jgi:Histidine kinase-, DNA gyrase B-, and HSP90-like ATPase
MGETRVDLHHLLEDLADAYPGDLDETILTEIVANGLDSGATRIAVTIDPSASTFTAIDNGAGMRRSDLRRFHDIAATSKTRGEGIGFAGVGIKLGLLVSETVVTESRRGRDHLATTWALAGRQRAPWHWIPPLGMVEGEQGTAVRLRLATALSPLLDASYIEAALRRHFEPLFDAALDDVLVEHYPRGVEFSINSRLLARTDTRARDDAEVAPLGIRIGRRRKPSAFGYLVRDTAPIADELRGVAISTFGKVIKRGWDWLGVIPAAPAHVRGLVEVPGLAACLTLNKVDFIRSGPRGATYLAYRKALQEVVSAQLAVWGDPGENAEPVRHRAARPVERDMEQVLVDLARQFPLLATLVEPRPGGKRRLAVGRLETGADGSLPLPLSLGNEDAPEPSTASPNGAEQALPAEPSAERERIPPRSIELPASRGPKRPARLGLTIQYESRPDDANLGRLVESTVWINDAHPAYRRAVASRSEGYHLALTVAMSLSSVAVEPAQQHGFVTAFLSSWGEALTKRDSRRRARTR